MQELRKRYNYHGDLTLTKDGLLFSDTGEIVARSASGKRFVADEKFMKSKPSEWNELYDCIQEKKYHKSYRNFSKEIYGTKVKKGEPPIYIVARERGGPSYKDVELEGSSADDIMFVPISKGFSMQGVSTFCAGPVVGEGLCVVNAAWKNTICIFHICGGGRVDLKSKNFWRRGKAKYEIERVDANRIRVDGTVYDTEEWLEEHREEWHDMWNRWRSAIALCSRGYFHWNRIGSVDDPIVAFVCDVSKSWYVPFVEWKKRCYIRALYDLVLSTPEFEFLKKVWQEERIGIGLAHPMAKEKGALKPITREFIRKLFDSNTMCCQPYVIAGLLLGVPIFEGEKEVCAKTSEPIDNNISRTVPFANDDRKSSLYDVIAYTDGACRDNGKSNSVGGWGYFVEVSPRDDFRGELYIEGYDGSCEAEWTTNNRMELTAMIMAMRAIYKWCEQDDRICIRTDSDYVKSGLVGRAPRGVPGTTKGTLYDDFNKGWICRWLSNGWKTANRKPVINEDLWKELCEEARKLKVKSNSVTIEWVRGHNGDVGNEEADRLANLGCDKASYKNDL